MKGMLTRGIIPIHIQPMFIESLKYARYFDMLITFNPHNHLVREVPLVLFEQIKN